MLDRHGHIKIVDFGLAVQIKAEITPLSPTGSLIYMAPELLSRSGGRHTDWWAVGVLAFELMTGRSPWSSNSNKNIIKNEIMKSRVMPPSKLSPQAGSLIVNFLAHDVQKRLGTKSEDDILRHTFFKNVDWAATEKQETPPAFVPPVVATTRQDREDALNAYMASSGGAARARMGSKNDLSWSVGLQNVQSRPMHIPEEDS